VDGKRHTAVEVEALQWPVAGRAGLGLTLGLICGPATSSPY
jgi:hypothetical protein